VAGGLALKTDDEELRDLLMQGLWKERCSERRFGGEEGAAGAQYRSRTQYGAFQEPAA
jgi:hypothetical protein